MISQHLLFWIPSAPLQGTGKGYLLAIVLCCVLSPSFSQDLPRTVVGNAGDYYENLLFGSLHFTVGEVAVARFENNIELGEGFHRSYYDLLVDAQEILPQTWEVTVFPNPTTEQIRFRWSTDQQVAAQLFNANGQLLQQQEQILHQGRMDMSQLPAGSYLLQLQDQNGRTGTFQILKVNH